MKISKFRSGLKAIIGALKNKNDELMDKLDVAREDVEPKEDGDKGASTEEDGEGTDQFLSVPKQPAAEEVPPVVKQTRDNVNAVESVQKVDEVAPLVYATQYAPQAIQVAKTALPAAAAAAAAGMAHVKGWDRAATDAVLKGVGKAGDVVADGAKYVYDKGVEGVKVMARKVTSPKTSSKTPTPKSAGRTVSKTGSNGSKKPSTGGSTSNKDIAKAALQAATVIGGGGSVVAALDKYGDIKSQSDKAASEMRSSEQSNVDIKNKFVSDRAKTISDLENEYATNTTYTAEQRAELRKVLDEIKAMEER